MPTKARKKKQETTRGNTRGAKASAKPGGACGCVLPDGPGTRDNDEWFHLHRKRYEQRSAIIKALAHPARLYIIDRLSAGECTVMQLTELIGCEMPTVSRHLAVLRSAGIVTGTKQGSHVSYKLETPCILNFFGCIEEVLNESGGGKQR